MAEKQHYHYVVTGTAETPAVRALMQKLADDLSLLGFVRVRESAVRAGTDPNNDARAEAREKRREVLGKRAAQRARERVDEDRRRARDARAQAPKAGG